MWRNQDGRNNENYFDGEISVLNIKFKGMAGVYKQLSNLFDDE